MVRRPVPPEGFKVPIVMVYYAHMDAWWSLPVTDSIAVWAKHKQNLDATYVWDYGKGSKRARYNNRLSRYMLKFKGDWGGFQHNLDVEDSIRRFHVVWRPPTDEEMDLDLTEDEWVILEDQNSIRLPSITDRSNV